MGSHQERPDKEEEMDSWISNQEKLLFDSSSQDFVKTNGLPNESQHSTEKELRLFNDKLDSEITAT